MPGCWFGENWLADKVIGQYLWFWIAAFVDIFLYIPLYFCLRTFLTSFMCHCFSILIIISGGNIDYDPIKRKIRIGRAENAEPVMQTKAGKLLWFVFFRHSCDD
jgi:hypothetical protein